MFGFCAELSEASGPVQMATAVALLIMVSKVWLAGHWIVGSSLSEIKKKANSYKLSEARSFYKIIIYHVYAII